MKTKNIVIAIDGPAGVGKSSVGKAVALKYGMSFLSTGEMYRCLGWKVLSLGIDFEDKEKVIQAAKDIKWSFERLPDSSLKVFVDGIFLGDQLHSEEVGRAASKVSSNGPARAVVTQKQKDLALKGNIVMEGRDIGTVIAPQAPVKIYLDASPEERAKRRAAQLLEKGQKADYKEILDGIVARDARDKNRSCAPLKPAADAIIIDTSAFTLEQVISKVMEISSKYAS